MGKISFSTWLIVGLAVLIVALSAALLIFTPQERWSELWALHHRYCYAEGWSSAAGDAGNGGSYFRSGNRFMGPHGRPPFFGFLFVIAGFFVVARFLFIRRRTDASIPILEERFAEGKIDEAEFTRKRSVLNGPRGKEE